MMYVTCMGGIYRFGQNKFREFLAMKARGKDVSVEQYATFVCVPQHNFTDLTADQARDLLIRVLSGED